MNRRDFLLASAVTTSASLFAGRVFADDPFEQEVASSVAKLSDAERYAASGIEEARALEEDGFGFAATSNARRSKTPISDRAKKLIIYFEVSSPARYAAEYEGFILPAAESGVTMGIGFDLGYITPERATEELTNYLPAKDIQNAIRACGAKGADAARIIKTLDPIKFPYKDAERHFYEQILPRYAGATEDALLNTKDLSQDSFGALVSLTYNRGPSYTIPAARDTGRYTEMRNIAAHMKKGDFHLIPDEILSMRRIWRGMRNVAGVIRRRELEAELFKAGLQTKQ